MDFLASPSADDVKATGVSISVVSRNVYRGAI